ncbi:MAG: thioesterase family protein [Erythrobacter sp.]
MNAPAQHTFSHTFRVRYAEVDPQAVVFNARYLEYADLVVTEFWRDIGLHFSGEGALEFHVVRAEVDFIQPIRADELVEGRATTARIGSSSVTTEIELWGTGKGRDRHGIEPKADLRARMTLVNVHVDLETGKPMPIPDSARTALQPKLESHKS